MTFLGNLDREDQLCAVAKAFQDATGWNQKHPENIQAPQEKNIKQQAQTLASTQGGSAACSD